MAEGLDKAQLRDVAWHALEPREALQRLESDENGLDEDQVQHRRDVFGPNRLPEEERPGLAKVFLRQFADPLIYILLIAAGVSLAIGSLRNAVFIFAVLLINAVLGTLQEWRAEGSAKALQETVRIRARAIRDGRSTRVDSTELVPGDIVAVEAGDSVAADLRLLRADNLHADESLLTGESVALAKRAEAELDDDTPLAERETLLHAGSAVVEGKGTGVVVRTAEATEVGRIAESLARSSGQEPPLVLKLRRFTRQIAVAVLAAVALLAPLEWWRGTGLEQIFFLSVALAVSAIPAGLPVAITVAMSVATRRMAERHVIVRQLPAVEGLGACTLVASDKTGTLTANVLTATAVQLPDGRALHVGGEGYALEGEVTDADGHALDDETRARLEETATTGALCNDGELHAADGKAEPEGDSVDIAFLVLAAKLGLHRDELLEAHREVARVPFEAKQRFAASFNEHDGTVVAHVKGAAEALLAMCDEVDADGVRAQEADLTARGYRVLAVARGPVDREREYGPDALRGLTFLGLVALIDPTRPEVPDAIARCRSAGVDVRMITGDHPNTGLAIARDLGMATEDDEGVTGKDLRALEDDPEARRERIARARVFARVEPTQKTDIVRALQDAGHFVAVTGDGVNDAPALKAAHIGVAMGASGTDVARGAADLILTDDNFASIVNGIEEGRAAYDNVRKVTWLLLATGAAEVLLFFLAILTGLPLPLTPVQLLWLNLVTNGIQDVALALEKPEPGVLTRKPRPPDQPLFDRLMIRHIAVSGGYIGGVAFATYWVLLNLLGLGESDARNLLLLLMVLFENAHVFSCRSETRSLFRVPLRANPWIVAAVVAAQGIHIAAMFVPGLNNVLGIAPVPVEAWAVLVPIAASVLLVDELAKRLRR